jgi:hypothetical protein
VTDIVPPLISERRSIGYSLQGIAGRRRRAQAKRVIPEDSEEDLLEAERLVDLVDRYVQGWNEPHPERRRSALAALYTSEARVVTQSDAFERIEAVIGHIGHVYDEFVGSGRYRFRSGGALGHHGCVLFRWEMVETDSGELADAGINLLVLAADGRIDADYQFVLGVDSSIGHLAVAP